MIQGIRIDDRLLHGQVAYSWKAALNYEAIVIASDAAAEDSIRKQVMKIATPDGVKLAVRSIEDSIKLLNDSRMANTKVFVVTESPENAYKLYLGLKENPVCILGGLQMHEGKDLYSAAVYLSSTDRNYLDKIVEKGIKVLVKQVPNDKDKIYEIEK